MEVRYELKYTVDANHLAQARCWLRLNPAGFRRAYPPRVVNTLYLDTAELRDLNANLAGVSQRQKLRLRWYGNSNADLVRPTIERKVKRNMLGSKERWDLPEAIDLTSFWVDILANIKVQLPLEWKHYFQVAMWPTLLVRYQREYFETPDRAIRATLDLEPQAFGQRFTNRPNFRRRLPQENTLVIELKAGLGMEDRLQEVAGGFPIRRTRNSKYVTGLLVDL